MTGWLFVDFWLRHHGKYELNLNLLSLFYSNYLLFQQLTKLCFKSKKDLLTGRINFLGGPKFSVDGLFRPGYELAVYELAVIG